MLETAKLTLAEINRFHEDGFIGPFTLCGVEEMSMISDQIERGVLTTRGESGSQLAGRHQDSRIIFDLAAHPAVLDRATGLLGPDLILWASYLWNKGPGAKEVPWHQDSYYWPLDPPLSLTAWIAIDHAKESNSCLRFIRGSHRHVIQHVQSNSSWFPYIADPKLFDAKEAVSMELGPGQFVLFSERTLHQSKANESMQRRLGVAIRFTVPFVKIYHDQHPLYPGHKAILLRGIDYAGINLLGSPPSSRSLCP